MHQLFTASFVVFKFEIALLDCLLNQMIVPRISLRLKPKFCNKNIRSKKIDQNLIDCVHGHRILFSSFSLLLNVNNIFPMR